MLDSINKLVNSTGSIAVNISGLLMTVAFCVFLFAVISYIWKRSKGDTEGLKQSGNMLFGSAFALFVMVAVWGITYFLSANLGIGIGGCAPKPSSIPGQVAVDNCDPTKTIKAPAPNNPYVRPAALPASNSIRPSSTPPRPTSQPSSVTTNTNTSWYVPNGGNCKNGSNSVAANGQALSCNNGQAGELCQQGTCSGTLRCVNSSGTDANSSESGMSVYGTCK